MTTESYQKRREIHQTLRIDELVKENADLTLQLKACEAEIERLKSANERLGDGLLTVTEKLENANNEIDRLDMVMKRHRADSLTIREIARKV